MLAQTNMINNALKGIKAQAVQYTQIKLGVKCEFTDNSNDRRYSIEVKELYAE